MGVAIETFELVKRYGKVTAVDRLPLRVNAGEIYAFLGLNGAGKTTTIRMLLGMVRPTAGRVMVLGTAVHPGQARPWEGVGYLVESPRAYPELTVLENLEVARRLHPGTPRQRIGEVVEQLGLGAYAERRAGVLSQGNSQRLGLAKALLHRPRLLILDEPTNGLDPAGIVEVRELLLRLTREEGVTILMSSHILGEVTRLAQRFGFIHQGRLLQEMDAEEVRRNRRRTLRIHTRHPAAAAAALEAAGHRVAVDAMGGIEVTDGAALDAPDAIACRLVAAGAPPTQLGVDEEELEPYFLRLIGLPANGADAATYLNGAPHVARSH